MPDVPLLLDHANPVPYWTTLEYYADLIVAQHAQGYAADYPHRGGRHPRKTPIVHRGKQ